MSNPIQPKTTQYATYRNGPLKGVCKSAESVLVVWGSGFTQSVSAENWDNRSFVEKPQLFEVATGAKEEQLIEFFNRQSLPVPSIRAPKM